MSPRRAWHPQRLIAGRESLAGRPVALASLGEALELARSCTSLTHSQPALADGPIRGSLGTSASRRACTYARSWSIRACT